MDNDSRRRTGRAARGLPRRNSSLVKGAIIQGIAPGRRLLQTAHKLWGFNFAILTERSDEWYTRTRGTKSKERLSPGFGLWIFSYAAFWPVRGSSFSYPALSLRYDEKEDHIFHLFRLSRPHKLPGSRLRLYERGTIVNLPMSTR